MRSYRMCSLTIECVLSLYYTTQYPVIPGELFYMSIRNEEKLRELQAQILKSALHSAFIQ